MYKGDCKKSMIVQEAKYKICNKIYIRNTQQIFQNRMAQYFRDITDLVNKNILSDTFAKYFASYFQENVHLENIQTIKYMKMIWQEKILYATNHLSR